MRWLMGKLFKPGGPSLRARVAVGTALTALTVLLASQLYSYRSLSAEVDALFNWRFQVRGDMLARDLAQHLTPIDDATLLHDSIYHFFPGSELWLTAVYRPDGSLISSTTYPAPTLGQLGVRDLAQHAMEEGWSQTERRRGEFTSGQFGPWARVHVRTIRVGDNQPVVLVMATSDARYQRLMENQTIAMIVSTVTGAVGSGVAAWFIAGIVLKPLSRMRYVPQTFAPANIRDQVAKSRAVPVEMQDFERELLEARAKLREFMLAQDRLISNISHEVNTPIAIVLTESQTLDQSSLSEEGRAFVLSVQAEMRHLRRTVDSFLLLTKLRTGKQITRPRPWHINDVMMDAIRAVTLAAETAGVSFRLQLAPDAIAAADGEPELVRVMLEHLLFNAIRHAGTMRQVGVATSTDGDVCTVVITDGGEPIQPDTLQKMFDRYQVAEDNSSRGPGIGLAIAQGLAELHSGSISAANRAEGGCEYKVTLPLNRAGRSVVREAFEPVRAAGN